MIVYHFFGIFDITISLFGAVILSDILSIVYQNKAIFDFKSIISFFEDFFEKYAICLSSIYKKNLAKMII
jgi:hypothetical protein